LSENFDYKAALEDRDLVESRIIEIERLIDDVEIIDEKVKSSKKSLVVDYGSVVRIQFEDGKEYKITIV
jgi:transcription elongation GreA/GreB family factor